MNFSIILAAGSGLRFGSLKQFETIKGKEVFLYSLESFLSSNLVDHIILVANNDKCDYVSSILKREGLGKRVRVLNGGENRFLSLISGVRFIYNNFKISEKDNLIVHDAARPNISTDKINKVITALEKFNVVSLGYKITDALKRVEVRDNNAFVKEDVDRKDIWAVTTPQGYKLFLFNDILSSNSSNVFYDETSLFVNKHDVLIIEDSKYNIKITYQEDLDFLKKII